MKFTAVFNFHGVLQDFLPKQQKGKSVSCSYASWPAVKDAIEAVGVPHPEVAAILVDGQPVNFSFLLQGQVKVDVYSSDFLPDIPEAYWLRSPVPVPVRFVLDVHLGKLARLLRMLGFDSFYDNSYADAAIAKLAEAEDRVVLTRDIGLLKHKIIKWGYWLRSQQPETQLREVIKRYSLQNQFRPFSRCLACNAQIVKVPKAEVEHQLPLKTKQYFNQFYQCLGCGNVYWKGSHFDRMQELVSLL
ncbi:Mut7-C RNAse domain-containing protein [Rufibacter roseus]|uniref:Mut7-C RNAse domain-containing protein n=1 Tax=Rufibacter roseus TaxID=1567108 RepID=A0ABW2DS32_9BACT|nr:Mut7-C RNAse domain-containing protein [Rufibacter roseus]